MSVWKFGCFIFCLAFLASITATFSVPAGHLQLDASADCREPLAATGTCDFWSN